MNHRESRQDILLRHNQLLKQCESYYQNKINEILTEKTQTLLRLSAQLYDKLKAHDDQTNTGSGFVFSSNVTMPSCASPTTMSNHSAKSTFPLAPNTVGANPVNSGISPLGPIPPLPPIPNFKLQPECHDVTLLIQEALLSMDDQQNTQSTAAAANDSTTNNAKDCLSESMNGALRSIFPVRNDGGNNDNDVFIGSKDPSASTIQLRYNGSVNTKESASSQVPHQYEPATSSTSPTKATLRRRTKPKKGNPMNPILLPPRIDGDQVKWPCSHCNVEYYASDDLVNHLSSIHSKRDNQKGFICPMKKCGKSLKSRNNLKRHIRTHTGDRPYRCDVCGKGFVQSGTLTVHRRCHTGERPYECTKCKKRFATFNTLKNHQRVHSGEKPFQCQFCFKKFTQLGSLNTHLRCYCKMRSDQGTKNSGTISPVESG